MFKILKDGLKLDKEYESLSIAKNFAVNEIIEVLEREDKVIPSISILNITTTYEEACSALSIREESYNLKKILDSKKIEPTTIKKLVLLSEDELFYILHDLSLLNKNTLKIINNIIKAIKSNEYGKNTDNFLTMKFPFKMEFIESKNNSYSYFFNQYINKTIEDNYVVKSYLNGIILSDNDLESCSLGNTYLEFLKRVDGDYHENINIMFILKNYVKFHLNYLDIFALYKDKLMINIEKYKVLLSNNKLEEEYFMELMNNVEEKDSKKEIIVNRYMQLLKLIKEDSNNLRTIYNEYVSELTDFNQNIYKMIIYFDNILLEVNKWISGLDKKLINLDYLDVMKEDILNNRVLYI